MFRLLYYKYTVPAICWVRIKLRHLAELKAKHLMMMLEQLRDEKQVLWKASPLWTIDRYDSERSTYVSLFIIMMLNFRMAIFDCFTCKTYNYAIKTTIESHNYFCIILFISQIYADAPKDKNMYLKVNIIINLRKFNWNIPFLLQSQQKRTELP